jgi:hypothetical protein
MQKWEENMQKKERGFSISRRFRRFPQDILNFFFDTENHRQAATLAMDRG